MESFPAAQIGRPKASEFVFARLRYDSGDWDYNPKVASNVLNSLVEYTDSLPPAGWFARARPRATDGLCSAR